MGKEKLVKNKIVNDRLAFTDSNIESLDEIIELYSDKELMGVDGLILSGNKLRTLRGLSKFSANYIDFSNNEIEYIDELPTFNKRKTDYYDLINLNLYFRDNTRLKGITNEAINSINSYNQDFTTINIYVSGCARFDLKSLGKIDFNKILRSDKENKAMACINRMDSNIIMPSELEKLGFIQQPVIGDDSTSNWVLHLGSSDYTSLTEFVSRCFIATATMGSYNDPTVLELRKFRDNWILEKTWGEGFVKWYYYYGAKVAKVIEKSFLLRKLCYLFIIKPLVYFARIIKKLS